MHLPPDRGLVSPGAKPPGPSPRSVSGLWCTEFPVLVRVVRVQMPIRDGPEHGDVGELVTGWLSLGSASSAGRSGTDPQ
jgi:hypothetical protein